ncbi:hypothetical protein J7M23_07365, partial [Candidatus Sumerlaeota bacterium]|nr:hypothetical protein [Candidatus Sumerlaeota bacterium]
MNKRKYPYSSYYAFLIFLIVLTGCSLFHQASETPEKPVADTGEGYIYLPTKIAAKYYGFNVYRAENKEG